MHFTSDLWGCTRSIQLQLRHPWRNPSHSLYVSIEFSNFPPVYHLTRPINFPSPHISTLTTTTTVHHHLLTHCPNTVTTNTCMPNKWDNNVLDVIYYLGNAMNLYWKYFPPSMIHYFTSKTQNVHFLFVRFIFFAAPSLPLWQYFMCTHFTQSCK